MSKLNINIDVIKERYVAYGKNKLQISEQRGMILTDAIKLKIPHGLSMADMVNNITKKSGLFNETFNDSASLDGLMHDIGRFEQFLMTGSLVDSELAQKTGILDHGLLGRILLLLTAENGKRLIEEIITNERRYDDILFEVVGNHTTTHNPTYRHKLTELSTQFKDYGLEEIIATKDQALIDLLISSKIDIVREADSLALFSNILSGAWQPKISTEPADFANLKIFFKLVNNQDIIMQELKPSGIWSTNSGALLRVGLLAKKANLLSTFKMVHEEQWPKKIYQSVVASAQNKDGSKGELLDPLLAEAHEFTASFIKNIIDVAQESTIVSEEEKAKALLLTKKQHNI